MNLKQLRQAVLDRANVHQGNRVLDAKTVDRFVNQANQQIASINSWPWLEATEVLSATAGTNTLDISTSCTKTRSITLNNGNKLYKTAISDIDLGGSASGEPYVYTTYGGQIVFYPTPDSNYIFTHRYFQKEPELTTDTDTPLLEDTYHTVLVEVATELALRRTGDTDAMKAADAAIANWLKVMQDAKRAYSETVKPRVRPYGWL